VAPLFCPGCRTWHEELIRDRAGKPRGCPRCASLERHRLLAALLPLLAEPGEAASGERLVVDVAPSTALNLVFDRLPGRHLRMDFDPAADGRPVDVRASVTAIPLQERSVDLLVCSHVLEHVPDDTGAMREIARVLAPDGLAVILVPQRAGATDEDPAASPQERLRRFGQADHVRYYGDDVDDRLIAAGLDVVSHRFDELAEPRVIDLLHLSGAEKLWLAVPADGTRTPPPAERLREQLLPRVLQDALAQAGAAGAELDRARAELGQLRRESRQARQAAQKWETSYRRLRRHPVVRGLMLLRRVAGRARASARRRNG
jgi:SAM-dependent methyltransferase